MAILTSFGNCMLLACKKKIDVKKKRKSHKSQNDFHHGKFIRKKASDVYSHFDSHTHKEYNSLIHILRMLKSLKYPSAF